MTPGPLFLCYDTETSGLPMKHLPDAHPTQPYLVELGCLLMGYDGREHASARLIVRPEGWVVPETAARVHGIDTAFAAAVGVPMALAVATWVNLRSRAHVLVGHNLEFDRRVMSIAMERLQRRPTTAGPAVWHCTKELAAVLVNLPPTPKMVAAGFTKPKPPTLQELHRFLFGEEFAGAHSAMTDARATARCYLELVKRGVVKPPELEKEAIDV